MRQEASLDPRTFEGLADETEACDPAWEREEHLHRVRWAMRLIAKEFEPLTLEAFRLHVLAGRPVAETADGLGISRDSVYQAKSRVLRRLRTRIDSLDIDALDV
jgi:RNA polymerase sigma-70 factor (ECF subfamily)